MINKQKSDFRYLSMLICVALTLLLTQGCGKDSNRKRTNKLEGFEEAVPLAEISTDQADEKLALDEQKISTNSEDSKHILPAEPLRDNPEDLSDQSFDQEVLGYGSIPQEKKIELKQESVELKSEKGLKAASSSLLGPAKLIKQNSNKIISISEDNEGQLLLADRYHIFRQEKDGFYEILNLKIYEDLFKEVMPAISTISQTSDHGLWVGFTNGEIITLRAGKWSKRLGGPSSTRHSVTKIAQIGARVFVAGRGFYEWDKDFDRFMSSDDLKKEIISDFRKFSKDELLIVTEKDLKTLNLKNRSLNNFYDSFTGDYPIESSSINNELIWIGGNQGILALTKNGFPKYRFATHYKISEIYPFSDSEGFLVLNNHSLGAYRGDTLFPLDSHILTSVSDVYLNSRGDVYLSLTDGNTYRAKASELLSFIKENTEPKTENFSEIFLNACNGAESLLGKKYFSRQISAPIIDGQRHVFFNGVQVCPNLKGFMRPDGMTVLQRSSGSLELFEFKKRKFIDLPEKVNPSDLTRIFIDSNSVIYLGTKEGLYLKKSEAWIRPNSSKELTEDVISDVLEDQRGNIWVSTRIRSTEGQPEKEGRDEAETSNRNYKALHLQMQNGHWAHFGKENGINTLGISSISEFKNQIYLGTPYGLISILPNSTVHTFSKAQGLKNFIIENLTIDGENRIWLSHGFFQNGLSWIKDASYFSISKDEGLFSNRIAKVAEDDNGLIWIMETSGELGVYSLDYLETRAKKSNFYKDKAFRVDFKP